MESKYVLLLAFISIILAFICSSVGLCLSASQHFKNINGYKKQNSNLSDKKISFIAGSELHSSPVSVLGLETSQKK